ncbi:CDP-glycerol glycerophosphotransferase family protein, partial [Proteus mirabilis]|nr:CDP-glycerol glycerophosphotransferase family protein [Proteus mirabilis]
SIYCDYLLLKKPVALLPYDLDKYVKEIGFSFLYKEIFPKTIIKNHTDFIDFCAQVSNDCFNIEEQNTLAEKLNFIPDNCSITDYNISIIMKEYKKRWPSE